MILERAIFAIKPGHAEDFEKAFALAAPLIRAAKGCRKQEGKVVLAGLQPTVQEVFKIGRFDMVFDVYPKVLDAFAAISPAGAAVYGDK